MPVRNQKFIFDSKSKISDRAAVFGLHKKIGWKSWGNKEQDEAELSSGKRYSDKDNTCALRNMQVAVIALEDNVKLLIEIES